MWLPFHSTRAKIRTILHLGPELCQKPTLFLPPWPHGRVIEAELIHAIQSRVRMVRAKRI